LNQTGRSDTDATGIENQRDTEEEFMIRFVITAVVFVGICLVGTGAHAFPPAVDAIEDAYPSATNLANCGTCHNSFTSGVGLNPYGQDVSTALGGGFDFAAAFALIEGDDSDGDGTSNIDEIETDDGFYPGWTCDTFGDAANAPENLADLVDPIDPGCDGAGTTTTTVEGGTTTTTVEGGTTTTTVIETTTTTTSTTSTTLPGGPRCSQPVSSGEKPVSTDCLYILQAAVGSQTCSPECICAPTGTLPIKATDALLCLNVAVGIDLPLDCPCNGGTTTTLGGTTTTTIGGGTTTTTVGGGTTTTTVGGGTTTTTLGGGTTTTTLGGGSTTTLPQPTTTSTTSTTVE
jgi:hypothetical protein